MQIDQLNKRESTNARNHIWSNTKMKTMVTFYSNINGQSLAGLFWDKCCFNTKNKNRTSFFYIIFDSWLLNIHIIIAIIAKYIANKLMEYNCTDPSCLVV